MVAHDLCTNDAGGHQDPASSEIAYHKLRTRTCELQTRHMARLHRQYVHENVALGDFGALRVHSFFLHCHVNGAEIDF